ncbi:ABC transporter ATP-binding protein [Patulibacter sp. NPDC049589]|uniref:ABC transporter ATP-binding protein n=1 Tax=Patulibacter sp. NPDC049589 TaxID=3154731 RepID=UPI00342F2FF4
MSTPLLQARGVTISYGGVRANEDVSITVDHGRFVGLIGANGAGKTTFVDAVSGFTPLTAGSVLLDGEDISLVRPDERSRRGLVRTFQSLELFDDLSVWDNVLVACDPVSLWRLPRDLFRRRLPAPVQERADWAIDVLGIGDLRERLPQDLSNGQRKLVALARALAARPKLLLLDEPASGLDSEESRELGVVLRGLLGHGMSVFMVDHDMSLVLAVCDEINVLDFGRIVASGTPAQIRTDPAVIAAYLGTESTDDVALDAAHA